MKTFKRLLTLVCVLAMVFTSVPVNVSAATTPYFKKTYSSVYENASTDGVYTYVVKNLKKGYVVKWSVTGAGKSYVSLESKRTVAAKTTVSNDIVIRTDGDMAAKGKKFRLKARVYNGKKLISTISTLATIQVAAKKITVSGNSALHVGESGKYIYSVTPVNTTYTVKYSASNESGADCSSMITSEGVFTPTKAGKYTVTTSAYNNISGKLAKSGSVNVNVSNPMKSVKQTAVNQIEITYYGDTAGKYTKDSYQVRGNSSGTIAVKSAQTSTDGKTVTLTLSSNMTDRDSYAVTNDGSSLSFTASCGKPVTFSILTKTVTVGKASKILYAVYDANGIDVTSVYPGTVTYTTSLNNAIDSATQKLTITTVGNSAVVVGTYKNDSAQVSLSSSATITAVAATKSTSTNFTITDSQSAPDYSAKGYADVRSITTGYTGYVHFRALDTDGTEFTYSPVTYKSSNPDIISISSSGKIQAYAAGTVTITVSATYGTTVYTYSYDITARAASYLTDVKLDNSSVNISNVYDTSYSKTITVSGVDQYGDTMALTNETAVIKKISGASNVTTSYNSSDNTITITARNAAVGYNTYTLTVTAGGKTVAKTFTVYVSSVPTIGSMSYSAVTDKSTLDIGIEKDYSTYKTVKVGVESYKGGVFAGYTAFTNATITKDGKYYSTDLTAGGQSSVVTIPSGSSLTISAISVNNSVITKAETGTYTVQLTYYSNDARAYATTSVSFTITDSDTALSATVERTTSSATCKTALELVKNCISVNKGEITDCTVFGLTTNGSTALTSGENYNITGITVKVPIKNGSTTTYCNYRILLGKTLANK